MLHAFAPHAILTADSCHLGVAALTTLTLYAPPPALRQAQHALKDRPPHQYLGTANRDTDILMSHTNAGSHIAYRISPTRVS
ncbi:hypothetical protein BDZ94DRAFT_1306255 [Collybia nuda]|uniref:Uncharacterized protein n=1 Tax=Collybia nuda TaxID=64659 RepID=A0A9P5YA90_9AGAR|nr:hypothetical protein BDZ94DRAFT_1306255 [Collybia nuda]